MVSEGVSLLDQLMKFANKSQTRKRQAVIRSAKMLARKLEGVELPPRAEHYLEQMKIRMDRLT